MLNDKDLERHPCFNPQVKGQYGRIHLPVAPKCNIQCNFCERKYDCVNESRPGVTSGVLAPEQAVLYLGKVLAKEPRITVAGIAGPGDPFANGPETMATLRMIREQWPEMLLCVSTNGMGIGPYIDDLAQIGVSHVTVTVCAVDAEIGARIYRWVSDGKIIYSGLAGAELLLARQLAAVKRLKKSGIIVKINCIVIPGVNDHHVEMVAEIMRESGVDLLNCMALFPNVNTPFGKIAQPSKNKMEEIRSKAETYLPQMRHCTRCRADAVGLLGEDQSAVFRGCLADCASGTNKTVVAGGENRANQQRSYVAVATLEGVLVNQHLGEAKSFQIWTGDGAGFRMLEERVAPAAGAGIVRWHQVTQLLADCRTILVSGLGEKPQEIIAAAGIEIVLASGLIETALAAVYSGKGLSQLRGHRKKSCGGGECLGSGVGCG
ncbi:MAG: nitrogenase cofactor biosynthesis protein NifB [Desulfobulbaceae bacterium]|jgi:nitrogen fixation protein NifB|nr:nitrogenase cofactor biosynthesis protein NifB [Desulfobulbaceae bacterium]